VGIRERRETADAALKGRGEVQSSLSITFTVKYSQPGLFAKKPIFSLDFLQEIGKYFIWHLFISELFGASGYQGPILGSKLSKVSKVSEVKSRRLPQTFETTSLFSIHVNFKSGYTVG
jgi:hypothetical protein